MRTSSEILAANIREMADRAAERGPFWLVSLAEPTDTLFATTADHAHTNLMASLYADRMEFETVATDRQGVVCIRTKTPICVLGVGEDFMRLLVATLRQNMVHGTYRKAGTSKEYEF